MTTLLVQNKKMKDSSIDGLKVFNFGIPAFKSKSGLMTCPMAGVCASGCYAKSGAYLFSNVAKAYEARLKATQRKDFKLVMIAEIQKLLKKRGLKKLVIRIHDSGDFYSQEYLADWLNIMAVFPTVQFYAYTKMIHYFKQGNSIRLLPQNFKVIFSLGGKLDSQVNQENDRHSRVFESEEALIRAGYVNASHDDMLAIGENKKIGLIFHHAKKFENTAWSKVA